MQVSGRLRRRTVTKSLAKFLRTLRTRKKAIEQRTQIQASAAGHDRKMIAVTNLTQNSARFPRVFPSREIARGRNIVDKVMWRCFALIDRRLRSTDFEFAIHRHRVAVDDLAMKLSCNRD